MLRSAFTGSVIVLCPQDCAVTLREEELRVDTFRSSGAGGQHVNTTNRYAYCVLLPA